MRSWIARRLGAASILLAVAGTAACAAPGMTAGATSMRSGPGPRYAFVMTIPPDAMIDVQSCAGSWCRVSWRYRTGYIPADIVSGPPEGPAYGGPPPVYVEPAPVIVAPYWGPGWGWGGGWRGGGWRR
jgi:SH3-like domain-containing protein